jgi:tetratricopeptide (TPR) repeat protein
MRSFFALVIWVLLPAACATEREAPLAIFADPGGMIVQKATRAALAEELSALQCKSILSPAKTSSAKVNTRRRPKAIDSRSPLSRHCQPNSIAASLFCSPLNTPRPKHREGKLDTAATYLHQALNGFARNSPSGQAQIAGDLGATYFMRGEMDSALVYLQRARDLHRQAGNGCGQARDADRIGTVLLMQGEVDSAFTAYREAEHIYRQDAGRGGLARTLGNLGNAYFDQDQLDRSLAAYEESLALHRQGGDESAQAALLDRIGRIHWRQGRLQQSGDMYSSGRRDLPSAR